MAQGSHRISRLRTKSSLFQGRIRSLLLLLSFLLVAPLVLAETALYRLTVENTWSETTHPGNFPPDAHFSWLGGGTHSSAIQLWSEGSLASSGIVQMAETGLTSILANEVQAAIVAGTAGSVLNWTHWFCPSGTTHVNCGTLVVEFEVDSAYPLVTLVSMLGPSPDWFIGVSGLALHDGTAWLDTVVADLPPYDGGTRASNAYALGGPLTVPQEPVSLITAMSGQLIGPAPLGTFTFERLDRPFVRGDVNADGSFDISDPIAALGALLGGLSGPSCESAADVNDDGALDISDPVSALASMFAAAPSPPSPFPACGSDPSPDPLGCDQFPPCP